MKASPTILRFSEVTVESGQHYETGLWSSSFELNQGELLLVRIERENERLPLMDAAEGLATPTQGLSVDEESRKCRLLPSALWPGPFSHCSLFQPSFRCWPTHDFMQA